MAEARYDEVAQCSEVFWEKLEAFHRSLGNKFSPPIVGGVVLDLHRLFVEVSSRGGFEKVIRDRRWKEVTVNFDFPATMACASFVLRKYYLSLLHHFEQVCLDNRTVPSAPTSVTSDGAMHNHFTDMGSPELQVGSRVTGSIDAKFDHGYLISIRLGSYELKGVMYHSPRTSGIAAASAG